MCDDDHQEIHELMCQIKELKEKVKYLEMLNEALNYSMSNAQAQTEHYPKIRVSIEKFTLR